MSFFIEKLKISNFLSFFGEFEVNLKPFSAVMCNFFEGKDDFFRALEFVFGAQLKDLRVENPLALVHEVLREEFLINRDVQTYVEITLNLLKENKQLKFCRSIKNGANNPRIEHKISNLITSSLLYEEKLNSLGIFIQKKNLIFYKKYFNNVIWGSSEDLEATITTLLRENYLLEDWRKANKEVEYLTRLKNRNLEKNYNSMKKSHSVLTNFTKKYEILSADKESSKEKILKDFIDDSSYESTPSLIDSTEENKIDENYKEKIEKKFTLEAKIDFLREELNNLKMKEAVFTSLLYHEEIKLGSKPVNASILQNRITQLKCQLQIKEKKMSDIWKKIQIITKEAQNLTKKISSTLISFEEINKRNYIQNRMTSYGRFCDYLQPNRYTQLLKQIIGNEIFYAHLCDSFEDAYDAMNLLKNFKYETMEIFIPFENYSHKLKDLIIASGEKGIEINNLEELLIFLCKLNLYNFIDEVPVIVQKNFQFENNFPNEYTIYIQDGVQFTNDGLIIYKINENDFFMETEKELKTNLLKLYSEEEILYLNWKDLLFSKWETLIEMNSIENDILFLKRKWRKSIKKTILEKQFVIDTQIYNEFSEIFKNFEEEIKKFEFESQEESFSTGDSMTSANENALSEILKELENVIFEKEKIKKVLSEKTNEIRLLEAEPFYIRNVQKNIFNFGKNLDRRKLFFEKEFKKLKKLIKKEDLEDFLGNQEWRKSFINSLNKDFNEIKFRLKMATEKLQNITTERKRILYKLFDHCSRYLSNTFTHILGDVVPFINLQFNSGEEKIKIFSSLGEEKINIVETIHFNTFIKFIAALSAFLEIANFDKIPLMILDDFEEFFPNCNEDVETILDENKIEKILPEKENSRFHLLMRLGQFLKHFIKKNRPSNNVRNNGSKYDYVNGPMQIIYFVKEDFVHSGDHCIWIHNQILPEEYLSENCDSYSEMHEINFNN